MRNRHSERNNGYSKLYLFQKLAVLVFLVVLLFAILWKGTDNNVRIATPSKIGMSPMEIKQIKNIGEWEFLSVEMEELVDTVDEKFLNRKQLARIYYGTARLGVDLNRAKSDWIKMNGDTVIVTLPKIKLLDNNIIDEGKTSSFFETGKWKNKDRKQLYNRAHARMVRRAMSNDNVAEAQRNAVVQVESLVHSMGYDNVKVLFRER